MSEPQHIERIFQEAFNSFEVKPDSAVWRDIKKDLKKENKSKGAFWLVTSGIALLTLLAFYNYSKESKTQESLKNSQTTTKRESIFDKQSKQPLFNSIPYAVLVDKGNKQGTSASNKNYYFFRIDNALNQYSFNYLNKFNNYRLNFDPITDTPDKKTIDRNTDTAIEKPVFENEKTIVSKKWGFTPYVSQTYFSSLKQGSPLDESLKDNKKEFETSQSFGLSIARSINNKWKISAGLSLLKLNYSTYDIVYHNGINTTNRLTGVEYNQYNRFTSVYNANSLTSTNISTGIEQEGSIKQEIAYIEIPVNVSYQIKDAKHYDLAVTGGFSSLILTKNKLSLLNLDGQQRYFGKANNLSNINASANASLEFNYHITNDLKLNIRPSFKYYLDMFEQNSGGFKPYSVGVATGIKINF